MAKTFAQLDAEGTIRTGRCPICGGSAGDPVRLTIHAGRSAGRNQPGRPKTDWLFRRGVTCCESCAVGAVEAALVALDPRNERHQTPTTTQEDHRG